MPGRPRVLSPMVVETLVVASNLDERLYAEFLSQIGRSGKLRLIPVDPNAPWEVPPQADVLLTTSRIWRRAPAQPPPGWPSPKLKWIQSTSTGIDGFPPWLFASQQVACARGSSAAAIAEFAVTAMLTHAKRWDQIRVTSPQGWKQRGLRTLAGATVGLAGVGAIGGRVAQLSQAFGAHVVGWRRSDQPADFELVPTLRELISRSDHLVVCLALTDQTRGLFTDEVFALAKPGLHIVNIARGEMIDEDALLRAMDAGLVGAATLDTTAREPPPEGHPFYGHPRVRLSPHISWSSPGIQTRIAEGFLQNVDLFLAGKPLQNLIELERGY